MGNDFTGLRNRFAKEYKQRSIDVQTNMLLEYAPEMLQRAYDDKTFRNDTWNLADSYVWVVFYDGVVKGSGFLWNNKMADRDSNYHKGKVNGRSLASTFIKSYTPNSKGWQVVWAATAPYSSYLESGSKYYSKFYVISSILDKVNPDFRGKAITSFDIKY